ncbi:MAG: ATP synthase subunit I [Chloroflexota bacterium]
MSGDVIGLALALFFGLLLGAFYFGGLWWTVQKLSHVRRPTLLFIGSLAVRLALVLAGLYLVAGDQLGRLVACLLGFLLARTLLVVHWRPSRNAG